MCAGKGKLTKSSRGARVRILVSGGILLALLAAVLFRGWLLERSVVFLLRRTLGVQATIARVGGNLLSGVDLRGVVARGSAGAGPVASLESARISARYALASLLRGRGAFLDSLELTVEGARVELDLTAPPAAGARAGRPSVLSALPRLPLLAVRDSRLLIHGRGFTLEADGMEGAVARPDRTGEQAVAVRADRLALRHPALREGAVSLAIAGRYAPRHVAITAAQVNGEQLVEHARLDLGRRPGDLDLQLALGLWRGTVEIGALRRADGTEVRWAARGVDLQPQRVLVNPALGALRGVLSTSGEVRLGSGGIASMAGTFALDWTGALLAGRAVDHLALRGTAGQGAVLVERAAGRIGKNEIEASQATLPAGPLFDGRWRALLAAASGAFSASLGDVPAFLAFWGASAGEGAAAVPDHRLRLEGALEKGRIRLARGDLATGLGKATLDAFTVELPREDQRWGEAVFSGGATFAIPQLQELSALFPLPPLAGSLRGEIAGTGPLARPEGRASLSGRGIGVAGRALGDVELQARAAGGRIELDSLLVQRGGNRFTVEGLVFPLAALTAADRSGLLDGLAGSFTLRAADLPALAALAGIPPERTARTPPEHLLTAAGRVSGREIAITAGSFAAGGGAITLRAGRVVWPAPGAEWMKDTTLEGDLEADFPDLGPLAALLRLPPLQGSLSGRARISGSLGAPVGSVDASGRGIVVGGHRIGEAVVRASSLQQRLRIEALEVTRGGDRLRGSGVIDLEKRTLLEGEAELSLVDVAPYLAEFGRGGMPLSGGLQVGLRAAGPLPGTPLVVKAAFAGTSGTPREHPIRASLDASWESGWLRVAAFELAGSGGLAVQGAGELPVDPTADEILGPGPLSVRARASIPALEELAFLLPPAYALTGSLSADVVATGSWKEPELRLEIGGERLQPPPETRFAPPGPWTLAGTLVWGRAEARAERVRLESPALAASLSGVWSSPPPLASLFAASRRAEGSLSLQASFAAPDVEWLRETAEGLRVLRGSVAGEIAVSGPAGAPELAGELRVAGGEVRYRDLPPLDSLAVRVSLAGRKATLDTFGGNLGGAPFTLAGSLDFSAMGDPLLDLRLQGKDTLLYRSEGLRLRADSDLTLRGPLSALVLAGEMALTNSLYQKDFTVASLLAVGDMTKKRPSPGLAGLSFPDPPLRDLRFDVRLTAREPLQVRTTVARGAVRPDLRVAGTGLLPILRGTILVDTARVLLPSGALEIERGTVLFREGDPDRPALDFGGRMQTMGYDVIAQVGGTLDSPEVVLSSVPPLPGEELLLLVLTGVPPGSGGTERGTATEMASPVAVYLGKNLLKQILGSGASSFPDRIDLQVGRELTRSGSVTLDARLLLKRNPLGHGSALYLTTEKDVYDQYNAGLKVVFKFK